MRVGTPSALVVGLFALYRYVLKNGGVRKLLERVMTAVRQFDNWKKIA